MKNNPKVSIIIPTLSLELSRKCIESIQKYTDLSNVEVIVVIQCIESSRRLEYIQYFSKLAKTPIDDNYDVNKSNEPFKILLYEDALGAVPALNTGINQSKGEYIVLLNDDCEILPSEKNYWLETLLEPFIDNEKMGCTGPIKLSPILGEYGLLQIPKDDIEFGFIPFYCALIKKEVIEKIGILDEDLKCGVDIDFCLRLKREGYEIQQVPKNGVFDYSDPTHPSGSFPLWHQAEATVHDFYGKNNWNEIIKTDAKILEDKFNSFSKPKLVTIVIPTMTRDYVNSCLKSIIEHSYIDDIDVIVVANGADPELKGDIKYFEDQGLDISLLWYDNPLGAVPALNAGIKEAKGKYVILLNDDCIILPYERKNYWIEELLKPFDVDPKIGITGPFKMDSSVNKELIKNLNTDFIIFFCAVIPNKIFQEVGILDENLKCGCDVDFCLRLAKFGYKINQVPDTELSLDPEKPKLLIGGFPIYHEGEGTVHKFYGHDEWSEIIKQDIEYLNNKYKDISNIKEEQEPLIEMKTEKIVTVEVKNIIDYETLPEGYFGDWDVAWYRNLIRTIPDNGTFAEIGVLMGRGLCSISDLIIQKNLKVYAIDLFDDFYEPLYNRTFERQLETFTDNLKKYGIYDYVTIIQGASVIMSKNFDIASLDGVFIDADHSYASVKEDILYWYPKVKPGGIVSGHDYEWPEVRQALDEVLGLDNVYSEYNGVCSTNCWTSVKPQIYDGFIFFNELDLLEVRLNELQNVVSKFIIVEGTKKFTNEPNTKRYFLNNMDRFEKFKDKIIYLVDDFQGVVFNNAWDYERHQRDFITHGWNGLNDKDAVIVSDCDEIPRPEVIANYKIKDGFTSLIQHLYYDYINNYSSEWEWVKILPYGLAKTMTPCQIRYTEAMNKIPNAGWHFTFMGGKEKIVEKMTSYAHQEYNNPEFLNRIEEALETGIDIFKRPGVTKTVVPIDNTYPKFILDNIMRFDYIGFIKQQPEKESRPIFEISWPVFQKKYELAMVQEFLKYEKLNSILEIGSAFGGTTMLWSKMVEPDGKVYACDLTFNQPNDITGHGIAGYGFTDNIRKYYSRQIYDDTPYRDKIIEIEGDSHNQEYIAKVYKTIDGKVDMLFIDGDHSYEGVKQDFFNFYFIVKDGGYIFFHDIIDSEYHRENGCFVGEFWNDIKDKFDSYEFIDQNWYKEKGPAKSMGIGLIKKSVANDNLELLKKDNTMKEEKLIPIQKASIVPQSKDILCLICTKNRYFSTLPSAIQSVINQSIKPGALLIYDDNTDEERIDMREIETYRYLFDMLDFYRIGWEVIFGLKEGQQHGHQIANKKGYKYVWRLDDDEIAAPDVLEKYLNLMSDDVGAVGGAVLIKGYPTGGSPKIERIYNSPNIQWETKNEIVEVDHLHSTFLYRAGIVDYCLDLSPVAHREETIFSHELKEKGYKLLVDLSAVTHHLKQSQTGIRSHNNEWFYKHDEGIFTKKMEEWGYKLINLNNGIGDHYAFLNILPELKKKWKHLIIGACYPEVFKDHPDVTLIDIADSERVNNENIYQWMSENKWNKSIVDAFATYYGVKYDNN